MLELATWNVAGLQAPDKLGSLVSNCRTLSPMVFLLQETHLPLSSLPLISSMWRGSVFLSPHPDSPTSKAGVMILVKDIPDLSVLGSEIHTPGHSLSIHVKWMDEEFWIWNIYAPAEPGPRLAFFQSLSPPPPSLVAHCLIGGDFNCLPSSLDRIGGRSRGITATSPALHTFTGSLDLVDCWRIQNPDIKDATCFSIRAFGEDNALIASRLDRWYSPRSLNSRLTCDIDHTARGITSDHRLVTLKLAAPAITDRGKGFWMLNTSLLNNPEYRAEIEAFLSGNAIKSQPKFTSLLPWWDWVKLKCKKISINFSNKLKTARSKEEKALKASLFDAKSAWTTNPTNEALSAAYLAAAAALSDFQALALEGAKIRSRVQWTAQGEKPTKYFLNLEKQRGEDRSIPSLLVDDALLISTPEILQATNAFYEDLYAATPISPARIAAQNELLNLLDTRVPLPQVEMLEAPITLEDLTAAVDHSARNKSPGLDGIPVDFYKEFWSLIGPLLLSVITETHRLSKLPFSLQTGVISLLFKKGDRKLLKNWRPISLLTADFKLLGKVLSHRLGTVLPSIISIDQTAVKGRWIMDSVHLVKALYDACGVDSELKALILFLDQEKAFDRVDHGFLFRALEKFGFGPVFTNWIKIMYQDAKSQIKVNNHLTQSFPITRGVRQGDPLSPLLFVIVIEVLANALRKCQGLDGVLLPGIEAAIKVSLYADDTSIFISDPACLPAVLDVLERYCLATDAKLNLSKCQGVSLNQPSPPPHLQLGMAWLPPNHCLTHLGIPVGTSIDLDEVWGPVLNEIDVSLAKWKKRNLSLSGRVLITKSLALSKLVYMAFAIDLPPTPLKRLQSLIWKFIWNGKRDRVSRAVTTLPVGKGGLDCFSIPDYLASFRLKILQRTLSINSSWTSYWKHRLSTCSGTWNLSAVDLICSAAPSTQLNLPPFWLAVVKAAQDLLLHLPNSPLLLEPIFLNPQILLNGKTLFQAHWKLLHQKGLMHIRQLWKIDQFRTIQDLRLDYGIRISNKTRDLLMSAIPPHWSDSLSLSPYGPLPLYVISVDSLVTEVGGEAAKFVTLSCRDFRLRLTSKSHEPPSCQPYWDDRWNYSTPWNLVWKNVSLIPDHKMRDIHWLLIHRKLALHDLLSKWFPDLILCCPYCPGPIASISHTFYHCPIASSLWSRLQILFNSLFPLSTLTFPISEKVVVTGLLPLPNPNQNCLFTWRILHSCTLYTIWVSRCKVVYGKEQFSLNSTLNLHQFYLTKTLTSLSKPLLFFV